APVATVTVQVLSVPVHTREVAVMEHCLTDQDLAALVYGSASPEQISAWKQHLERCASCAARLEKERAAYPEHCACDAQEAADGSPDDGSATDGLRPGPRLGDFEIERRLGSGGMGVVYRARQLSLDRPVALKVLRPGLALTPKAVTRFQREAQAAAKLHHTNNVAVHAEGEDRGVWFLASSKDDARYTPILRRTV